MNDFTKDELEYLKDYLIEGDSFFTRSKYVNDLIDKLQSMIDGYCEHENIVSYNGAECVYWCMDCSVVKGAI